MTTKEGAIEISDYLILGAHHSTPEAKIFIENILSDVRSTVAIEWFHKLNESKIKLLKYE